MHAARDLRIGIVGAGCAGLAAAAELRALGYRHITLLEARDRPGGQTVSPTTPGADGRPVVYEGGTVWAIPSPHIDRLARAHGVSTRLLRRPPLRYLDLADGDRVVHPLAVRGPASPLRRARELLRYLRVMSAFRRRDRPGFAHEHARDPAMLGPIEAWFRGHGLEFLFSALFPIVGNTLTGGHLRDLPAIYYLKILALLHRFPLPTLLRLDLPHWAAGNDALWKAIAAAHDVRYGQPVRALERGPVVRVRAGDVDHVFDRVLWAAPLVRFADIADVDDRERALVARVRHFSRVVLTCRVRGLPPAIMLQVLGQPDGNPDALPYSLYEVQPGSGVYNLYSYLRYPDEPAARATAADVRRGAERLLARLGAELLEVRDVHVWDRFFPHFPADALRDGLPGELADRQGRGGLYVLGDLVSHITVPLAVEAAIDLVRRHFAGAAEPG